MKYRCSICGYVYDEAKEGVAFAELPEDWQCPLCGAPKSAFEPEEDVKPASTSPKETTKPQETHEEAGNHDLQQLTIGQMAALCSNLARGCEKQYMPAEQALFTELADWFTAHTPKVDDDATVESITARLQQDLTDYKALNETAARNSDRGAQRVCVWGEKVTRMLTVLMAKYQKEGEAMLDGTDLWVCSVCGFVYVGKSAPELCPVCKVPAWKFNKIERRVKQ